MPRNNRRGLYHQEIFLLPQSGAKLDYRFRLCLPLMTLHTPRLLKRKIKCLQVQYLQIECLQIECLQIECLQIECLQARQIQESIEGALSRLPPDSDVLETFTSLRRDGNLSDEEAFLKLITTYGVPLSTLNRISSNLYPVLLYRQFLCVAPCSYITNTIDDSRQKDYPYRSVTSNIQI